MPELVGLYLTPWALAGLGVVVHEVEGPVHFVDLYGEERHAPGALSCAPGEPPELWISAGADLVVLVHELAHAFDCLDDGELNGSPTRRPDARPAWTSDYCWSSDPEWYACSVVHHARAPADAPPPATVTRLEPVRFAGSEPAPAAARERARRRLLPAIEVAELLVSSASPDLAQTAPASHCRHRQHARHARLRTASSIGLGAASGIVMAVARAAPMQPGSRRKIARCAPFGDGLPTA